MAKITALPFEETPDGSETVVLVKGGATKQASLSALVEPIVQPYADIAEAAAQAFRVESTILRPDQLIPTSVGANAANTRIVGPPAGRDGVIKRIRIRFVAAGSVDVRVYDRTSGIGPIAEGHRFEQSGPTITLTATAAGWRQFDVDLPISEGQFVGFTSAANVTGYALASAVGFYDNYGVPSAEADPESLTITGTTTAFVFLIGFDIVSDVVTAEAFDGHGQRVTALENSSAFFAPTPDDVLTPHPGRQGVIGTIGPVWSDGVSWYQTADNNPLDLAWTRIAALAARDGWEGIYDIGNPYRRTLVGDGIAALSDATSSLPDLVARSTMPSLDAAIGGLPAIKTGGSGPTPLRSSAFAQPLSDDYTVMFVAQADAVTNGKYFLDGNVSTNRISVLINADSFRLFTLPGGEFGTVPADTEPHLFAVTVATTAARMTIDHATVATVSFVSAPPPALPGLTLADRHAPSGDNSLQGKIGPVLVYRGKINAAAELRMRKLLTELGDLAPPTINATSTLTASSSFASSVPFLVCGKTGTGESLFSLAVVCDLPGGSRGAFVALRAPSIPDRVQTVTSMVNYCAWEDA